MGGLSGGALVHDVIVIDACDSMNVRADGARTPFEHARGMVGRMLDKFEQNPNRNDKVTLVSAGVRTRFLVRGDLDVATARAGWTQLQKPDDAAGDLNQAMRQVTAALEESNDANAQVYVFTDLQQRSFGDSIQEPDAQAGPELTDTLRDTVERLTARQGLQLHWIDCGPMSTSMLPSDTGGTIDNVQITNLELTDPAAVMKTSSEVIATIKNLGTTTSSCEVTLDIDGGEPIRKVIEVPPGGEGEADFQVTFRTPTKHRVRASLVNDNLATDDERFLTVDVRDRIRILLVDGKAAGDPLKSYSYIWEAMLDPDEYTLPMFAVEVVDLVTLLGGQCTPKDYDVTVLADVERLNNRAATAISDALMAGRGVLCQFGPQCEIESYNLHLHASGDGPMPFRLLPPIGGAPGSSTVRSLSIVDRSHPLLREFEEDVYREILAAIPLWRWHGVAADSMSEEAATVLRMTDAEQTPLLISRSFGEGHAVFLGSPIGSEYDADRWNRLDDPLVAFPLLFGTIKYLALPAVDPFAATVGSELSCSLPARPQEIEVGRPERDGRPRAPVAEAARPLPGGRFALPPFTQTTFAGFYNFDMVLDRESGKEPISLPFAVNVDTDEGDLRYPSHAEVQAALGLERILDALPATASAESQSDRNELGPSLLLLTLLFVLGEAALARFVASRRT